MFWQTRLFDSANRRPPAMLLLLLANASYSTLMCSKCIQFWSMLFSSFHFSFCLSFFYLLSRSTPCVRILLSRSLASLSGNWCYKCSSMFNVNIFLSSLIIYSICFLYYKIMLEEECVSVCTFTWRLCKWACAINEEKKEGILTE